MSPDSRGSLPSQDRGSGDVEGVVAGLVPPWCPSPRSTAGVIGQRRAGRSVSADRRLVRAAALGDEDAWAALVDAYAQLVWQVCRDHGLRRDESSAACALVWRHVLDALPALRAELLRAWLVNDAEVESLRALARTHHEDRSAITGGERRCRVRTAASG